jgi:hypothetical protein
LTSPTRKKNSQKVITFYHATPPLFHIDLLVEHTRGERRRLYLYLGSKMAVDPLPSSFPERKTLECVNEPPRLYNTRKIKR